MGATFSIQFAKAPTMIMLLLVLGIRVHNPTRVWAATARGVVLEGLIGRSTVDRDEEVMVICQV